MASTAVFGTASSSSSLDGAAIFKSLSQKVKERVMNPICTVVGRFQVPELSEGHRKILDYAIQNYQQRVLVLGVPATRSTKENPLDFQSRKTMIQEEYPGKFKIAYLKDMNSDYEWSKALDALMSKFAPIGKFTIIGSKDFLESHYVGTDVGVKIIQPDTFQFTRSKTLKNLQYRYGAYDACQSRWPTVYPTVDCAIFDDWSWTKVWLAKKPHEDKLRFVGGFADPKDSSFEETALREAKQETGLDTQIVSWIGSAKIDDWRYRTQEDKIITNLFAMVRVAGNPKASDDISELHLVSIDQVKLENIQPEHRVIAKMVKEWASHRKVWSRSLMV